MKKLLLFLCLWLGMSVAARAQYWDSVKKITQVLVWNADGTYAAYRCADHPVVKVVDREFILRVNGTEVIFPADEARKFTFDDEQLTPVEGTTMQGSFDVTQDAVKADGLKPGTAVEVYDLNGRRVATAKAAAGSASVDISALSRGVYVVKAGSTNFKFMKR